MNFVSDNVYGVDEAILSAMVEANDQLATPAYGADAWTKRALAKLDEVFECKVHAFLLTSGTAANGLGLSSMAQSFNAVLCYGDAHINVDECGAPVMFTGGAKLYGIDDVRGKVSSASVAAGLAGFVRGERDSKPSVVSLTQASELGTVYSRDEIAEIAELAHGHGLKVHVDGARFANALVAQNCSPAELTWKAGVDALSFGATKNGAMALEAVILFDDKLAEGFGHRRLRGGQLLSKGRFLGAQMEAYLTDDRWLKNAARANEQARRLADGLAKVQGVRIPLGCDANLVFPIMPQTLHHRLQAAGALYHPWPGMGPGVDCPGENEVFVRMVTSFATPSEDVDKLIAVALAG